MSLHPGYMHEAAQSLPAISADSSENVTYWLSFIHMHINQCGRWGSVLSVSHVIRAYIAYTAVFLATMVHFWLSES